MPLLALTNSKERLFLISGLIIHAISDLRILHPLAPSSQRSKCYSQACGPLKSGLNGYAGARTQHSQQAGGPEYCVSHAGFRENGPEVAITL
jgi:hypothetical protein